MPVVKSQRTQVPCLTFAAAHALGRLPLGDPSFRSVLNCRHFPKTSSGDGMTDPARSPKDLSSSKFESQSDNTTSFTNDPDATRPSDAAFEESISTLEPKTIGPYRLIKKLGQGGMGQVWLAEQTAPVRRQVALKLIKAGLYDDSVLQRFLSERQSLAIMEHP